MGKTQEREPEIFEMRKAVRHRVPQLLCIYGIQFSGKTFGAFLIASGLVKPGGKIGFLDTENGRGSAYADDPDVMKLIPQGFTVIELGPPFHPRRYVDAINQFQGQGFDLLIVDSGSHAWEGDGGGLDIKEEDKHWKNAKLWSKRMKFAITYSSMDIIVCLRAQEKTKITGEGKSQVYTSQGILPISEKSLPFDMGTSIRVEGEVDGKPATHLAVPVKWPKAMNWLFNDWTPQLLTPEVGRRIREWNDGGAAQDEGALLQKQARYAAELGVVEYSAFFGKLSGGKKKFLTDTTHADNKRIASEVDAESIESRLAELHTHDRFVAVLGALGYESLNEVQAADRERICRELEAELADAAEPKPTAAAAANGQSAPQADPPGKPVDSGGDLGAGRYAEPQSETKRRRGFGQ